MSFLYIDSLDSAELDVSELESQASSYDAIDDVIEMIDRRKAR